jgi:hypothetical protein
MINIWGAIAAVTSVLTLVAFIAACVVAVFRAQVAREIDLIRLAPDSDRGQLIATAIEKYHIDTGKFPETRKFDALIAQLQERRLRLALLVGTGSMGTVTLVALYVFSYPHFSVKPPNNTVPNASAASSAAAGTLVPLVPLSGDIGTAKQNGALTPTAAAAPPPDSKCAQLRVQLLQIETEIAALNNCDIRTTVLSAEQLRCNRLLDDRNRLQKQCPSLSH